MTSAKMDGGGWPKHDIRLCERGGDKREGVENREIYLVEVICERTFCCPRVHTYQKVNVNMLQNKFFGCNSIDIYRVTHVVDENLPLT